MTFFVRNVADRSDKVLLPGQCCFKTSLTGIFYLKVFWWEEYTEMCLFELLNTVDMRKEAYVFIIALKLKLSEYSKTLTLPLLRLL